eukprot:2281151-Amphidinium_carterae.1
MDTESSELTEWHTYAHCACHAAHNALKWSLASSFDDTNLVKMVYVGIQSARSCYIHLTEGLGVWIEQVLQPTPVEMLPGESDLAA